MTLDPKQVLDNAAVLWMTAETKEEFDRFDGLSKTYAELTGLCEFDAFWTIVRKAHFGDKKFPY